MSRPQPLSLRWPGTWRAGRATPRRRPLAEQLGAAVRDDFADDPVQVVMGRFAVLVKSGDVVAGGEKELPHGLRAQGPALQPPCRHIRLEGRSDGVAEQRVPIHEVVVEGHAVDPGAVGDVLHGQLLEPLLLEHRQEGVLDELPRAGHAGIRLFPRHRPAPNKTTLVV